MAQQTAVEQGTIILNETSKVLVALLEMINNMQLANRGNYNPNAQKAHKVLLSHVKNGGNLLADSISPKDAAIFEQLLKAYHIPFVSNRVPDENGEERIVFFTRDTDKSIMDTIRNRYMYELHMGLKELSINDFIKFNEGQNVAEISGLSEAMVAVFKHYSVAEDVSFTIAEGKDGTFSILYTPRDENGVMRAIKAAEYDLSGKQGEIYKKNIENDIHNRETFFDRCLPKNENEIVYVVDSYNPSEFIAVTSKDFSIHSLHREKVTLFDGSTEEQIVDKNSIKVPNHNRQELEDKLLQLRKPIVLTAEEMSIISGITDKGVAEPIQGQDFIKAYKDLTMSLKSRNDFYEPVKIREMLNPDMQVHAYTNLLPGVVKRLNQEIAAGTFSKDIALEGDTLAFTDTDKAKINTIIIDEVKKEGAILDDFGKLQLQFMFDGRGYLTKDPEDKLYVVDAKTPNFVFRIDDKGFTIVNLTKDPSDTLREITYDRADPGFEQKIIQTLKGMNEPVILDKKEYEQPAEVRNQIIQSRIPENVGKDAKAFIYRNDDREREQVITNTVDKTNLTDRQKQAIKHMNSTLHRQTYIIDQSFIDKFAEGRTKDSPKQTTEKEITKQETNEPVNNRPNTTPDIDH